MSTCSGCGTSPFGSAERAFRLLNFTCGPSTWRTHSTTARQHDRAAEHLALVHEVGQPVRVRFGPELVPGAIAFHRRRHR